MQQSANMNSQLNYSQCWLRLQGETQRATDVFWAWNAHSLKPRKLFLRTVHVNWTVLSASDVADWMYYKRIHVFLGAGSSNSPQIWGHSCTIVNAVSWCTGQIFICAPLSSNSQPRWACRWFHWKPGLHVQSACHESCVTTWFGTICYL